MYIYIYMHICNSVYMFMLFKHIVMYTYARARPPAAVFGQKFTAAPPAPLRHCTPQRRSQSRRRDYYCYYCYHYVLYVTVYSNMY